MGEQVEKKKDLWWTVPIIEEKYAVKSFHDSHTHRMLSNVKKEIGIQASPLIRQGKIKIFQICAMPPSTNSSIPVI